MEEKEDRMRALAHLSEALLRYVHLSKDYERTPSNYGLKEAFGLNICLNHMEIHMLSAIQAQPGISGQELAAQFNRTKGSVSQIVKTLTRSGLIIKRENPQNARINNLYATEIGMAACQNHAQHEAKVFERLLPLFSNFSQDDFHKVSEALAIFVDYFQKERDERENAAR